MKSLIARKMSKFSDAKIRYVAFLLSNIFQKTGQLLLLGLLVYLGSVGDVYRFGLFVSLFALMVPLLAMNIHTSIGRIYYDIEDDQQRRDYLWTCLLVGVVAVFSGAAVIILILQFFSVNDPLTLGEARNYGIILGAGIIFLASQFFNLLLRLENRTVPFFLFGLITGLGAIIISVIGIWLGMDPLYASILGYSGGQLTALLYAAYAARSLFQGGKLSFDYFWVGLNYSIGTVLFASVQWIVNYSGRWIGGPWIAANDMASYTLIGQFLVAVALIITTLYESNRPIIMRYFAADQIDAALHAINARFVPSLKIVFGVFLALVLGLPLIEYLAPKDYNFHYGWIGAAFVQMLAYSFSLRAYWLAVGLRRTKTFGVAALLGGGANISIALIWGPIFGVVALFGAAAAGLIIQTVIVQVLLRHQTRVSEL